jgi:(2Fe-2S) ferredoxin
MGPPFQRHVFICVNKRPPENPKGCCADKGGEEVRERFKIELDKRGLKGAMRANAAGCLDMCSFGVTVVVYPEGVWYGRVKPDDVTEIIESHLIGGQVVERLLLPVSARAQKPTLVPPQS